MQLLWAVVRVRINLHFYSVLFIFCISGVAPLLTVFVVVTVAICVADICAGGIVPPAVVAVGKPPVAVAAVVDDAALAAFLFKHSPIKCIIILMI